MVWTSLFFLSFSLFSQTPPKFLTKHSPATLRFVSMDGRYAYVKKKPGVLGLVSSFRSIDFLTAPNQNDFLVKSSYFKKRLVIESIPNAFNEFNLFKNHQIYVVDYGNTVTREIGQGQSAKLHLEDEWITYYDTIERLIHIENLITKKKFTIKLSKKDNPFFVPEIEMVTPEAIYYTDINNEGYSALIAYNLITRKSNIISKSSQTATHFELCQNKDYIAVGEFPYNGAIRGSKIQYLKKTSGMNLAGFETVYSANDQDKGNMVCTSKSIFFVKDSQAVKLDVKSRKVVARIPLNNVTQLIEMDGRVLAPKRGEFYVLEGSGDISDDSLKKLPPDEELQIDI